MSGRSDGFYATKEWHKLRAKTKSFWKRNGLPCGFCGAPINWSARPVVDHIKNRRQHPHLAHDPANLQVVCHACNTRKAAWVENSKKPEIGLDGYPVDES